MWKLFLFCSVSQPIFLLCNAVSPGTLEPDCYLDSKGTSVGAPGFVFRTNNWTDTGSEQQAKQDHLFKKDTLPRQEKESTKRVHSTIGTATTRVGLLIPWCGLSDLSKCKIPIHMFYLFYESPYTMSRCLIQGVIFFLGLRQLWLTFGYSRVALHWHQ